MRGVHQGGEAPVIAFTVNGRKRSFKGPPFKRLLDVLREDFGLTATKEGCGEGECGACTVLLDGKPVTACLVPVCQAQGRKVETAESLGRPGRLNPLQRSFQENAGVQCGFCTPGLLMSASRLKKTDPEAVRVGLAGHLCRCTGYMHIVESVSKAPSPLRERSTAALRGRRALARRKR
ncbi:MAG: (2Fe-2S)-binding protein [Elusimicrobia bacterium]|nr:(2Fe-2S)-binding protein [Elusimicrobiota bacterium]